MSCFQPLVSATTSAAFPLPLCARSTANLKRNDTSYFRASVLGTKTGLVRTRVCARAVNVENDPPRPLADFQKDIWGERFLALSTNALANENEVLEHEKLKEEVRKMIIAATEDPSRNLDLVDTIQRLGVSYHFEEEINELLQRMHENLDGYVTDNADNFHKLSLCFRLLRQQGYRISCEMLSSFIDEEGNFKKSIPDDIEGMLSLYEAAHFRIHEEHILENALIFSVAKLKSIAKDNSNSSLTRQITHAMRFPIRKTHPRIDTRFYISTYQEKPSHNSWLLKFSKLDFNIVQKQDQMELSQVSRWWKEFDVRRKFPYARDRIVETYFWMMLNYFEPQYAFGRVMTSKAIALTSITDDTYDAYGTFEELKLLTEAIERWDPNMANQLPVGYIKNFYVELLDLYDKIEDDMAIHGTSHKLQYTKAEVKRLAKAYLREVEWAQQIHTPTVEEYMEESGLVTSGCRHVWTLALVGIVGNTVTKETFEWLASSPKILRASSILCRYYDDIPDYEFDKKRSHIPSVVECYMKQYGVTSKEAIDELFKQMDSAWKDINEGCLSLPKSVPMSLVMPLINYVCLGPLFFYERDAYTHADDSKEFVTSILVEPIPY